MISLADKMNKCRYLLFALQILLLSSCSSDNDSIKEIEPQITLITSINGPGDNGYNDLIIKGVMTFAYSNDIEVSLIIPTDTDVIKDAIRNWKEESSTKPSILLLASNEYCQIAREESNDLSSNKQILLFESRDTDMPDGVCTFNFCRYGASYLAGYMAQKTKKANIVYAKRNDWTLEEAGKGFKEGFKIGAPYGTIQEYYLADDNQGYSMPDSTYRLSSSMEDFFVYPLAGGSNNGFYKYSRDNLFSTMVIAGMDTDCGAYSSRVPFSVVLYMEKAIQSLLSDWHFNGNIPKHTTYDLESGYIDIVENPFFYANLGVWDLYYGDPDYWKNLYNKFKDEAIKREKDYERSIEMD